MYCETILALFYALISFYYEIFLFSGQRMKNRSPIPSSEALNSCKGSRDQARNQSRIPNIFVFALEDQRVFGTFRTEIYHLQKQLMILDDILTSSRIPQNRIGTPEQQGYLIERLKRYHNTTISLKPQKDPKSHPRGTGTLIFELHTS